MTLPVYKFDLGAYEMKMMKKHIWDGTFVNARLHFKGKSFAARIRYRGGHTRNYPKKSYEVRVGDITYHFNAEYDDPSMMRNALSFHFFQTIGVPSPLTRHCELYMNGVNEGVYLLIEAVNRKFFRRRKIKVRSLVYADNDSANFSLISPDTRKRKRTLFEGYRLVIGSDADRTKLKRFVHNVNKLKKSRPAYLKRRLDTDNYLRWLAGAVLTGNYDGFDQNYALYEHAPTGKYRIIPWDYEGTWGRNCYGERCSANLVRITGYNQLTEAMLARKPVRSRYRELLEQLANTAFTTTRIMPAVEKMHQRISSYLYHDSNRKWPYRTFASEPDVFRSYIQERREIVLKELEKL